MTGTVAEAERSRTLPDLPGSGELLRHPSGARILLLRNADPNLVFGIGFPTLPEDDTGIAHILEHAVLSGSAAYPGPSPFAALMRGSLNTFLNAMTLPDLTLYAVASPHAGEFRTLVDVYLDAVFAPLLTVETFRREGWRLDRDAAGQPQLQGIVYNEMKGHYASAQALMGDRLRQALYPDTVQGRDYGGAPPAIPGLTHAALRDFHRHFYAPANALVVLAGEALPDAVLGQILDRLDREAPGTPAPVPAPQPAFDHPRHLDLTYPGAIPTPRRDGLWATGWLLDPPADLAERLAWRVLDELLVGAPDAALRRALVEAGLAADLVQSGFSDSTAQPEFRLGLTGTDPLAHDAIEARVIGTLATLARDGFDPADLAAALNRVEFRLREGKGGPFPAGIWQMFDAFKGWQVAGDPFAFLDQTGAMMALAGELHRGSRDLRPLLTALLDARHRVTLRLAADPGLAAADARAEAALAARLAADAVPDAPDPAPPPPRAPALLARSDLPRLVPADPIQIAGDSPTVLLQPLPTRGIVHLDVALDLAGLALTDLPLARFLGLSLTETGTAQRDRRGLARWIGSETGGIVPVTLARARVGGGTEVRLVLRGKALAPKAGVLAGILAELLATARFDDPARLGAILARERARAEAGLTRMGHEVVDRRIRAALTPAGAAEEAFAGLGWLDWLRAADPLTLGPALDALRGRLAGPGAVLGPAADPATLEAALAAAAPLVGLLAAGPDAVPAAPVTLPARPAAEALETATAVSFVGLGGDLAATGFVPGGAAQAAIRHLASGWLWDEVREKGGAYGAMARLDPVSGVVTQLSYRDPNLLATLDTFRASARHLDRPIAEDALTAALIATLAAEDRPRHPGDAAFAALERWLTGQDPDWRQARRDALLAAVPADFRATGAALAAMAERVVVLAGPEALDRAEAQAPGRFSRTRLPA